MKKSNQVHVHVEGQLEICDLPMFRNTPNELKALNRALKLTQVTSHQVIKTPGSDVWVLFAELNLGDVSETALRQMASYVIHRVEQKAKLALAQQRLAMVR